ncbi:hypothetical protein VF14_32665 [Nostoc linckia z18]|uniref:Uncharacterized protein n=2 Tax=Nostoc linckia TaxID=92942 RepID=A0A9Q5Z7J8_NOSLI|nr:hypothetical protein [Nostoc linckia]PHK33598.1 hypothetical protein VF12_25090 [Nostoc linckia z15]PHK44580.1 hypothetical protein VF13_21500 [Nostoc linckia z16]PHJ59624.1 hypothetical protein VF02_24775 [Nostoc linckia z1]PHJ59916.1 hypothetical protein VF03_34005 [Nostoc linckia z2]PHJ65098.1 hypothetical protein VF05_21375 [Nostoc linckia z3]
MNKTHSDSTLTGERAKAFKKSFDATPEIESELVEIAKEMGVPQSAVIVFALKDFFLKYHREKHERTQLRAA